MWILLQLIFKVHNDYFSLELIKEDWDMTTHIKNFLGLLSFHKIYTQDKFGSAKMYS